MQSAQYFCPISNKSGYFRHIFLEVPNIKFHENAASGSRSVTRGATATQT